MVLNMNAIIVTVALSSLLSFYNVEATSRSPSPSPSPDYEALCFGATFPSECRKSLEQFLPRGGASIDGRSALSAGLTSLIDRTQKAILLAGEIKKKKEADSAVAAAIDVCVAFYHNVANSAKRAQDALNKRYDAVLEAELDAEVVDIYQCEDTFKDSSKSPLEEVTMSLMMVARNNLFLANRVN